MVQGTALYRLPHAAEATWVCQTEGNPAEFSSCVQLNGREGFVMAPFAVTPSHPILLIRPDRVEQRQLPLDASEFEGCFPTGEAPSAHVTASRRHYAVDFANYHAQLEAGAFRKIVLARCASEEMPAGVSPVALFNRACELYPRMFISLVYTAKSGCWLMATPEILLEGSGANWHTIALAGTMKLEGEQLSFDTAASGEDGHGAPISWTTKNIQEQRFVATYIAECLEQFTADFREEGPYTVRAADLVHLRSDFSFTLPDTLHLGNLLQALHPTPAVCGLPKRETLGFILRHEHTSRRYYSGFVGMMAPAAETHLYVSLRCMDMAGRHCRLYAGGGLLRDSREEQEWNETEAKLETMRRCISDCVASSTVVLNRT